MIGLIRKVLRGVWEYPVPSLLTLILLGVIGLGGTAAGWSIWGWYQFQEAERALGRRDFVRAQAYLERCLEVRSSSAETHFLAARTARRAGNLDDAERHLKESLRLGELRERVDLERTLLRVQRGDLSSRTETELQEYVQNDHPDSILILETLVKHYIKTYQMRLAVGCLNLWLEREPANTQALMWRGEAHERQFAFQDALQDYRQVLALDPQHDEARQRLAEALVQAHQPEAAVPHFEYLLERQPENPALLLGLARCRHLLNDVEEARKLLDKLLSISANDVAAMSERGRLALEMGQPSEAERWLRKAWDLAPYEKETTYALYLSLTQLDRPQEAREFLDKLGNIEKELGRLKEITRTINDNPHDPGLRHEAGMIFLRSGQAKEGIRWLNSALQEDPHYQPAHQALMEYYESIGDQAQAARHRQWAVPGTAGAPGPASRTRR